MLFWRQMVFMATVRYMKKIHFLWKWAPEHSKMPQAAIFFDPSHTAFGMHLYAQGTDQGRQPSYWKLYSESLSYKGRQPAVPEKTFHGTLPFSIINVFVSVLFLPLLLSLDSVLFPHFVSTSFSMSCPVFFLYILFYSWLTYMWVCFTKLTSEKLLEQSSLEIDLIMCQAVVNPGEQGLYFSYFVS